MPDFEDVGPLYWRKKPGKRLRPLCAASGLLRAGRGWWIAADDLNHLVELPEGETRGLGHRLFPGKLPKDAAARKKVKKDLEALVDLGAGRLLALPSGSKPHRTLGGLVELGADGSVVRSRPVDFGPLLRALGRRLRGLNVEGGFVAGRTLTLLQRGNARGAPNALAGVPVAAVLAGLAGRWPALAPSVRRVELGAWGGVPLGFTDGFFHDGVAYFAAAAEAGGSSYRDGAVVGSILGALRGGKPVVLARAPGVKVEGLALERASGKRLSVRAVTDADDPDRASRLMRASIEKV